MNRLACLCPSGTTNRLVVLSEAFKVVHQAMEEELRALIDRIERGIRRRGYFVLMDERADQICGEAFEPHNLIHIGDINMLATRHGWDAVVAGRVISFSAKVSEPVV